ncbi:hypothetical protein F2Q69_00028928 [Brassica cretica]|uniref:Uncharacterized protein n=1 Tax=Brassica cretica TaxID=69181 RepID=A0A8S9S0F4_BRACR|nr:hypothetical protein F2Q69_00028928 [Brassica cretica]
MHSGCFARWEQSLQTILRENHQIALFSVSFAPTGPSPIQCNSCPGKEEEELEEEKKDQGWSLGIIDPSLLRLCQKSRVRSRCFSKPFAKVRALLIAEIDKGEESMEEAFTQE